MTHRILVADGHWLTRRGLRATLEEQPDHEVVAEAATVEEFARLVEQMQPNMALVNLALSGGGAIAALRRARERSPRTRVIVLGADGHVDTVREALRAGCEGYVSIDGGTRDLIEAVERVRAGHVHLDPETARRFVLADVGRGDALDNGPLQLLSEREREVFRLIGAGYTNRAAAERIRLSHRTVEKYRAAVMQKLNLRSAVDLRLLALKLGATQVD